MPSLLVLAAGLGSRYGGLKQIDPVGPSGETLLDYAVFDALRAGFDRVVFVIRRDFADAFRAQVIAKYSGQVRTDVVYQELETLPAGWAAPAGRQKPWGTGHAVWCAREAIREPFAVINADDFYGAGSFRRLAAFLRAAPGGETGKARFCLAGFRLDRTLSEHGAVARGVCAAGPDGGLTSIVEQTGITPAEVGPGRKYSGAETVSMNCWGFTPAVFAGLDRQLGEFLAAHGGELKAEFYLPAAVSAMIARGEAAVQVLPVDTQWFGVTYREDKARVQEALAQLSQEGAHLQDPAGTYPRKLF
jgi:NDP-sugar pyrophosphorylase family protein